MSYDYDDYGNPIEQNQNGPAALREAHEKAKARVKELEAELAKRDSTISDLTTKVKSSTLRDAFTDAGIDAKYARFAERDGVEPTTEAVQKWREENAEVYAFLAAKAPAQQEPVDNGEPEPQGPVADNVPPGMAAVLAAAQGLESQGQPVGSSTVIQTLEGIDPNKVQSREELLGILGALGAPLE